jgi:type IV pilus assembly protein PilN
MRVTLNLATRPFTDHGPALRHLRIGIGVLTGLCLLFLLGLHLFDSQAAAARAREHSLDGALAFLQRQRQDAQAFMRQPDNAQLLTQTEFLNERFDEKAFSWTLAMEAMETVLPAGVQVTSIEPQRTKDGRINVELRVVGPHDRSIDLVRNLEHSHRFIDPRIEGESAENTNNGPNQRNEVPVSASNRFEFELFADYNPPTPEERAALNTKAGERADASPASPPPAAKPRSRPLPARPLPGGRTPYTGPAPMPLKPNPAAPNPAAPNPAAPGPAMPNPAMQGGPR